MSPTGMSAGNLPAELTEFSDKRKVHLYEGLKSITIDLPYVRKNVKEFIAFSGSPD